jgi:hypothetical protein
MVIEAGMMPHVCQWSGANARLIVTLAEWQHSPRAQPPSKPLTKSRPRFATISPLACMRCRWAADVLLSDEGG